MKNRYPLMPGCQRRSLLSAALLGAWPWARAQGTAEKPDAARFFHAPQMLGAVLSPDGRRLAMVAIGPHGRALLSVLDLDSMKPALAFSSTEADVHQVVWVNPTRLAFTLNDRETPEGKLDAGPGLFAVDHDGSNFRQLVERQRVWARNGNDSQRLEPWNTFLLNGTTLRSGDEVLVARPEAFDGKDFGYVKLLRLNTRTGRTSEIEAPLHAVGWWPDAQGNLRVVVTRQGEQSALRWRDPADGAWKLLSEFNTYTGDGDLQVRHVGADGRLYMNARRGQDKQALWQMDPATGSWSAAPLARSPQFDLDAHIVAREDKVLGWRFTIDAELTQWVDADMQALQQAIDKVLPRTVNRLSVPWSGTQPWVLVEAFSDTQPMLYLLFNRETRKFTRLGAQRPDLDAKQLAGMDMVRIPARDGLEIPAWLTLPRGAEKKQLPLVVLVHGGPFVRAPSWQFDAEVQFLAARGYAVLQPQFRGTLGFGAKHQRAGWKQWGKAMQSDLADATRWAIAQGIADPGRIAIAGASYGGYAALMGLVRDAELYRCAVAWVGVTDLDMLHTVRWDDVSDDYKRHGMPVLLGDRVKDAADLKENSPLTHAAAISKPLLLAYGSADKRVPLVHGESFRKALQAGKAQPEWVVYEDEGHGWRKPANQVDFWNRVARFLDRQLAPTAA